MSARIFIDGEAGTTGLGIAARLRALPGIELISLGETQRKNRDARLEAITRADVSILCLPDEAAREVAAMAPAGVRLIDASTAHRTRPDWVFGMAELAPTQTQRIATAARVANPGCYATAAIALLRPLIEAGLLAPDQRLTINAISGYSGGGKTAIAAHAADGGPAFELYGLGLAHKHVPEIMIQAKLRRRPLFVPSVGHFAQGMLVSIPLFLDQLPGAPSGHELAEAYQEYYRGRSLIAAYAGIYAGTLAAETAGNDVMELFVCANTEHDHAVLVARLDNLGKGASGAAVQNLRIMLGGEV